MLVAPDDYLIFIPIRSGFDYTSCIEWANNNNIEIVFAYGNAYFKNEEDAILFRLRYD